MARMVKTELHRLRQPQNQHLAGCAGVDTQEPSMRVCIDSIVKVSLYLPNSPSTPPGRLVLDDDEDVLLEHLSVPQNRGKP